MKDLLKGKKILVIGGTGTIGKALIKEMLIHDPFVIRVFSRDEYKQFIMEKEFKQHPKMRFLVGDVRDKDRIKKAMEGIDIVFNLAAMKHVPACEYNPFEAVKTNIIGTQNVIEAAIEENVKKVVYTSSDKSISPTNTMGATKLLAEKLMQTANYYKGLRSTAFSCVRFGNVMGSRGSVIPLVKKQIDDNTDITITNRDMTRFIMSIDNAVSLILEALNITIGGEVFVLKMPVVKIGDLIEILAEEYCIEKNLRFENVKFKEIGLRSGEKMYEELMTYEESKNAFETENMYVILPEDIEQNKYSKKVETKNYHSDSEFIMTKQEVRNFLNKNNLLK